MAYDWSTIDLAATPWRSKVVPHALPILIRWAKEGEPRTYSDLGEELFENYGHRVMPRKDLYGAVAGAIANALDRLSEETGERIPPLHAILVNKRTRIAGEGAIRISPAYFAGKDTSTPVAMRAQLEAAMDDVFNWPHWDRIAAHFGVDVLEPASGVKDDGEPIPLPVLPAQMGAESEEHQALKAWVAAHPEEFEDLGVFPKGSNEKRLSSGDRLDAYFKNDEGLELAVEVKTSACSEDELKRGVFQAVKYRAVLRAMQKAEDKVPNGEAVLVCTRKPTRETKVLMKRLNVRFQLAPLTAEK